MKRSGEEDPHQGALLPSKDPHQGVVFAGHCPKKGEEKTGQSGET
jgi:hypothetical protein